MITGAVDSTLRRAFLANGVDATILNFLLVRRLLLEIADEAEAGLGPVGDDREKELIDIIGGDSTEQSANSKDESSGESSEITSQSMIIAIGVSCDVADLSISSTETSKQLQPPLQVLQVSKSVRPLRYF